MSLDQEARVGEFLNRFFAPPNGIPLVEVMGGKWKHVQPWVDSLRVEGNRPTVLPCRRAGRVFWYGLAFTDAQYSSLRDDLIAFVGPTYSTYRGNRDRLDPTDPVEGAVLGFTEGRAIRFTGPLDRDDAKPIWAGLELMRSVLARRPAQRDDAPRPTGRVLRDFFMALRAGNREGAEDSLRYLGERGRLDPLNLLFLRTQANAELGDWEGLLGRTELPDLLQVRRPVAVTEALMCAVYHVELERYEEVGQGDEAIDHFRSSVLPRYGTLLMRRAGIRAPAAVKLLMLQAVGGEPTDPVARDALLAVPDLPRSDRLYLALLAKRLEATGPGVAGDPIVFAADALTRGLFDRAFELLVKAPDSVRKARGLLECAYDLQTLEVEKAALDAVDALEVDARMEALRGRLHRETYDRIVSVPSTSAQDEATPSACEQKVGESSASREVGGTIAANVVLPGNWIDWLHRVTAEPTWSRAVEVARRGATEWSVEELLSLPHGAGALVEGLASVPGSSTLQLALPHILTFYQRDPEWPRAELASAYLWTLEQLAFGSRGGRDDLSVFHELAQGVLSVGADALQYATLIESAELLCRDEVSSYQSVDWSLDLLDLLASFACPCPDLRVRCLSLVVGLFRKNWHRLQSSQWEILGTLCAELGQEATYHSLAVDAVRPADSQAESSEPLQSLRGRSVAIYTLTERAGMRMRNILERRVPSIKVHVSSERVGSESLRQLARTVDVFVVVTASAKHAATGYIESHRPREMPTLRPVGKGTASMLRVLEEYLQGASPGPRAA